MTPEFERYVSRLEQLLSLLRALADEFVASRKDFVAMDLDGIYGRIAEQEELCRQLAPLLHSNGAQSTAEAGGEDPGSSERLRRVMQELREASAELWRLNQVHAAFLRRSGKTVDVLLNAVANYALTYAPPSMTVPPQATRS